MALWGKSTSAESRPKWLGGDGAQGASGAKEDAFANTAGWAPSPPSHLGLLSAEVDFPHKAILSLLINKFMLFVI
jgi:hypothetical protein